MKLYPTQPSILTLVTWVQRTQAGLRPHQARRLGRRAFGPRPRSILTHPASLAAGGYVRPFGPNKNLIRLKPTRILDSKPHYTAQSCPTVLYPTPQSILTLVTWVQRTQAGLRPSPHVGWPWGLRPSAIKILTLPALLAAGGYVRPFGPNKSLILLKPTRILDSRPHYTAPSCPTATVWATTFTNTLVLLEFLYTFGEGGPPSKLYKTPSKGGPWLLKVKLLKLCRTTRSCIMWLTIKDTGGFQSNKTLVRPEGPNVAASGKRSRVS